VKKIITPRLPYFGWNFLASFPRWTLLHETVYPAFTEFQFCSLCTVLESSNIFVCMSVHHIHLVQCTWRV
jgi:hypothetical protein